MRNLYPLLHYSYIKPTSYSYSKYRLKFAGYFIFFDLFLQPTYLSFGIHFLGNILYCVTDHILDGILVYIIFLTPSSDIGWTNVSTFILQ